VAPPSIVGVQEIGAYSLFTQIGTGENTVILKDGKRLPLSRNYRAQLEEWLREAL
jgi:hypothetical protein